MDGYKTPNGFDIQLKNELFAKTLEIDMIRSNVSNLKRNEMPTQQLEQQLEAAMEQLMDIMRRAYERQLPQHTIQRNKESQMAQDFEWYSRPVQDSMKALMICGEDMEERQLAISNLKDSLSDIIKEHLEPTDKRVIWEPKSCKLYLSLIFSGYTSLM